jgi:hypothetical protein
VTPEVDRVLKFPIDHPYSVVIPAYDESPETLNRLLTSCDLSALAIVVVNRGVSSPWAVKGSNDQLITWLLDRYGTSVSDDNLTLLSNATDLPDVLLVNRNQDDTVIVGGVGQARSIGCDLALVLHNHGRVKSPWIQNTDADSILPADFFDAADRVYQEDSALCMRVVRSFSDDPELQSFADMHDVANHMALIGMERAHAPWGIMVTGCGLGISTMAYQQCGGVQPYERAEDGHLINAAGKVGRIHRIYGAPVMTEARSISRPPAGFGTTIASVRDGLAEGLPITCSSPEYWDKVAAFYSAIELCLKSKKPDLRRSCEAAAKECCCEQATMQIMDTICTFVGPVDMMARVMPPKSVYETVHLQLDLRKSRRAHQMLGGKLEDSHIPIKDAIRTCVWAGGSQCPDVASAVKSVMDTESYTCAGDTGARVWADRIFGAD